MQHFSASSPRSLTLRAPIAFERWLRRDRAEAPRMGLRATTPLPWSLRLRVWSAIAITSAVVGLNVWLGSV